MLNAPSFQIINSYSNPACHTGAGSERPPMVLGYFFFSFNEIFLKDKTPSWLAPPKDRAAALVFVTQIQAFITHLCFFRLIGARPLPAQFIFGAGVGVGLDSER